MKISSVLGIVLAVAAGAFVVGKLTQDELPTVMVEAIDESEMGESEHDAFVGTSTGTFELVAVLGERIMPYKLCQLRPEAEERLERAAAELVKDCPNCGLRTNECYRSVEQQIKLIWQNCQNPPGSTTCNPKPGKPPTCMLTNGPSSCPHTTGLAVDVWVMRQDDQGIWQQSSPSQRECLRYKAAALRHPDVTLLHKVMKGVGFRSDGSCWHFDLGLTHGHPTPTVMSAPSGTIVIAAFWPAARRGHSVQRRNRIVLFDRRGAFSTRFENTPKTVLPKAVFGLTSEA